MSNHIYFRILGYIITLVMHFTNLMVMKNFVTKDALKDPHVKMFKSMEYRFFTAWTFFLQMAYAVFGLLCDILILINSRKKDYRLPKLIGVSREIMFSGLVWPCSWVVFSVFWSVYMYDRKLIFPDFLEKAIPPVSNHIIHTMIVPVALWEVVFRPRPQPTTHKRNILQLILHLLAYLSVMLYTYLERGLWLYPFFAVLDGTIHFFLLLLGLVALFIGWYYVQWGLTYVIHGSQEQLYKKIR